MGEADRSCQLSCLSSCWVLVSATPVGFFFGFWVALLDRLGTGKTSGRSPRGKPQIKVKSKTCGGLKPAVHKGGAGMRPFSLALDLVRQTGSGSPPPQAEGGSRRDGAKAPLSLSAPRIVRPSGTPFRHALRA